MTETTELKLTPAEAVFGLLAWLTTRETETVLSSRHDAAPAADIAAEFCKANNLGAPRYGIWPKLLKFPEGCTS